MNITKIEVRPTGGGVILAWVNLVIDDEVAINDLRIMRRKDGVVVVQWPVSQLSVSTKAQHICCPITRRAQEQIDQAILDEYYRNRKR